MGTPPPVAPTTTVQPPWALVVGVIALGVAVLFLMGLVVVSIMGHRVDCSARFPVAAILAFCAAIGAGFLGNDAAVKGSIPIPGAANHPIVVGAGGGIAVLIIMLYLGNLFYISNCQVPQAAPVVTDVRAVRTDGRVAIHLSFEDPDVRPGESAYVEVGDERFSALWDPANRLDNPHSKVADFAVSPPNPDTNGGHLRLVIKDPSGNIVVASVVRRFTIQ